MSNRDLYHSRRSKGLCVDCGDKAEHRRVRCRRHARAQALSNREYMERNQEQLALMREHKRWSLRLSNPGIVDDASRDRYAFKVRNGMCADCPRPADDNKRYCARCHAKRLVQWRRCKRKARREAKRAERQYMPMDTIVSLTRVRILRAALNMEWFSTYDLNNELGAMDLSIRNAVTQMLGRLAKAGALARREALGNEGLRAMGGRYEYNITDAGRAEVSDVLSGRRRPNLGGAKASWAA